VQAVTAIAQEPAQAYTICSKAICKPDHASCNPQWPQLDRAFDDGDNIVHDAQIAAARSIMQNAGGRGAAQRLDTTERRG
jgi:hypothetical protein